MTPQEAGIYLPKVLANIEMIPFSGCWIWMGQINKKGYGLLKVVVDGKHTSAVVHRVAFEATYSEIPKGLVLDHLCRVRCCANPDHVEIVTHQINILRGIGLAAINAAKVRCLKCGSEFSRYPDGGRRCRVCIRAYKTNWMRRKRAKLKAARLPKIE